MQLKWIVIGRQEWTPRLARAAWKGLPGVEVTLMHAPDASLAALRLDSHPDVDWIFCPAGEAERLVSMPEFHDAYDSRMATGGSIVLHALDEPAGSSGEGISLNGEWVPWSDLGAVLQAEFNARFENGPQASANARQ